MKLTGSQALMQSLIDQGTEVIFGYPGGAIMPVYDALYDYQDKLRHVLVRHEQGAAHAAEGYARIMNKPGVCMATSGPGATNLVTGIADAMMDSVPIVCITGQVASALLGTDAFQETDIVGITTPITKWNYQITKASEIPSVIAKAFHIANSGRPGPVLIDITKDAQFETYEYDWEKDSQFTLRNFRLPQPPDEDAVIAAAEVINNAKKPLLLVGHGVLIAKAEAELMQFAKTAQIPVASTLHGLSAFPTNHPLFVGMLGMHGNYGPNLLTNEADVIIAVGMRFDDRVTGRLKDYAPNATVIHIEIDPAEIDKMVKTIHPIVSDAKQALSMLNKHLVKNTHDDWIDQFKTHYATEFEQVIQHEIHPTGKQIKMAQVINVLSEKTEGQAVVVADVGQHQMVTARYYHFAKSDSFITSGGLGTMGFALPAAIGAKVAATDRPVVAVIGDGCFQMTIQELATIAQEQLPVKIIILNNNFLGMVRQWQQLFFEKRYSFVNLQNPDFTAITKGFFIDAETVEDPTKLDAALDRMLTTDGPYLLNIMVEKEENVFPMIPTGSAVSEVRLK